MKLKLTYIFFLLWSHTSYATTIDSLRQLLTEKSSNKQTLLTTHLQLADALRKQGAFATAATHITTVEKQLAQEDLPIIKVHLLLNKGLLAYSQYKDEEALSFWKEGYQLNQQHQAGFCFELCSRLAKLTPPSEAEAYLKEGLNCPLVNNKKIELREQLGNLYTQQERYEEAIEFYTNNQQLAKSIKDTFTESRAYQNIGVVYLLEGKWKQAANSYLTSKDLKEKIGDKQGLTDVQHNLAMVYFNQKQYDKSLEYYQQCADYYNNQQDTAELLEIWSNTASVYIAQKKYNKANTLLNQVLSQLERFPNPTKVINSTNDIHFYPTNPPQKKQQFHSKHPQITQYWVIHI